MTTQTQSDKRPREWWIYKTGKLTLASDIMLKNVKVRFLGEPPVFVREVLPDTQTNTDRCDGFPEYHGCVSGDCPHDKQVDCFKALFEEGRLSRDDLALSYEGCVVDHARLQMENKRLREALKKECVCEAVRRSGPGYLWVKCEPCEALKASAQTPRASKGDE